MPILDINTNVCLITSLIKSCKHCPFTLSELVTFESCLAEAATENGRTSNLIDLLASKCYYIEPTRKAEYSNRTIEKKLFDRKRLAEIVLLEKQITTVQKETEEWASTKARLKKAIQCIDIETNKITAELRIAELLLKSSKLKVETNIEQVARSFDRLVPLTNKIMQSLRSERIVCCMNETDRLLIENRNTLIKELAIDGPKNIDDQQLVLGMSYLIEKGLGEYSADMERIFHNLKLIELFIIEDLPRELELRNEFASYLEDLRSTFQIEAPQKTLQSESGFDSTDLKACVEFCCSSLLKLPESADSRLEELTRKINDKLELIKKSI